MGRGVRWEEGVLKQDAHCVTWGWEERCRQEWRLLTICAVAAKSEGL
jgi:hypothetical protein